jgi:hypothetical protein
MDLTYILIGVAAVVVIALLFGLFGSKKSAPHSPPAQRLPRADAAPATPSTTTTRTPQAHSQPVQRPPVEVQQTPFASPEDVKMEELTGLVGYDGERANRYVARVERNNPGKSRLWCIEKAIEDVLRDRHAR